jgi:methionine-R-sulfoxide reductase
MKTISVDVLRIPAWVGLKAMVLAVVIGAPLSAEPTVDAVPTRNTLYEFVEEHPSSYPIERTEGQWRDLLTEGEYRILRQDATESEWTGGLIELDQAGTYYSRATGQPLFSSRHKYDSGTGWPSFYRPIDMAAVDLHLESVTAMSSMGVPMTAVAVKDSQSGSHLGHILKDGPEPTGLRYCINAAALVFVPEGEDPPPFLRELSEP